MISSSAIAKTRAGLKEVCDKKHSTYGGPASARLGKGLDDTLEMLLNIKNQLDRMEKMLAAAPRKK